MIKVTDPDFHEPSYAAGFAAGESDIVADYNAVLDEIEGFDWPEDKDFWPSDVAAVVADLARRLRECQAKLEEC